MSKRIVRLTESELVSLVKRIINEDAPEPVLSREGKIFGYFLFPEGSAVPNMLNYTPIKKVSLESLAQQLADYLVKTGTFDVLKKLYNNTTGTPTIPKFIKIKVGTSHTGAPKVNDLLSQKREKFLENIVRRAFDILGVSDDKIGSLVMTNRDTSYDPSKIDRIFDPSKRKPDSSERFGDIEIIPISIKGLESDEILGVQKGLKGASSKVNTRVADLVDEDAIVAEIQKLKSPSDVKELNDIIEASTDFSGLEDFLNDQLFDDPNRMQKIVDHLDDIAKEFFGQKAKGTVRNVKGSISIGPAFLEYIRPI